MLGTDVEHGSIVYPSTRMVSFSIFLGTTWIRSCISEKKEKRKKRKIQKSEPQNSYCYGNIVGSSDLTPTPTATCCFWSHLIPNCITNLRISISLLHFFLFFSYGDGILLQLFVCKEAQLWKKVSQYQVPAICIPFCIRSIWDLIVFQFHGSAIRISNSF